MAGLEVAYKIFVYIALSNIQLHGIKLTAREAVECDLCLYPGRGNEIGDHLAVFYHVTK